jgi:hypothetical protein
MTKKPFGSDSGEAKIKIDVKMKCNSNAGPEVPRCVDFAKNSGYGVMPRRAISCFTTLVSTLVRKLTGLYTSDGCKCERIDVPCRRNRY